MDPTDRLAQAKFACTRFTFSNRLDRERFTRDYLYARAALQQVNQNGVIEAISTALPSYHVPKVTYTAISERYRAYWYWAKLICLLLASQTPVADALSTKANEIRFHNGKVPLFVTLALFDAADQITRRRELYKGLLEGNPRGLLQTAFLRLAIRLLEQ